jgi:hypothetical protein
MQNLRELLGSIDRAHLPQPGSSKSRNFKEWYHFNIVDPDQGLDIIFNFSLAGDVSRAGAARTDVIGLCHLARGGWFGTIDTYDAAAVEVAPDRLLIELGPNRVTFADGAYQIAWRLQDESFILEAKLSPRVEPLLISNDTSIGSGSLNWLIVPDLEASGQLIVAGTVKTFCRIGAYHDQNWGYWKWGEDFGWDWGFATEPRPAPEAPALTFVFGRTASLNGDTIYEQTLAVWNHAELAKFFTRRQIRSRREGRHRGDIPRLPGAARLIDQGRVLNVPARYGISARDDPDWLDIEYSVETALQISVPTDFGFGLVDLNETFGTARIRGEIGGRPVAFVARACFEFMG